MLRCYVQPTQLFRFFFLFSSFLSVFCVFSLPSSLSYIFNTNFHQLDSPPRGSPTAASKPAETKTSWGLNCVATGSTTCRKAARYSASPIPPWRKHSHVSNELNKIKHHLEKYYGLQVREKTACETTSIGGRGQRINFFLVVTICCTSVLDVLGDKTCPVSMWFMGTDIVLLNWCWCSPVLGSPAKPIRAGFLVFHPHHS